MLLRLITTVSLAFTVSASKLFVSSYTGNITTFNLTHINGTYNLVQLANNNGCSPNASWLHLDAKQEHLYCVDEGIVVANGSLTSFKVDKKSGILTQVNHTATPLAPVNSVIYTSPSGTQLLAVAHYAWAFTTYKLNPVTGSFSPLQRFNFTMKKPGPNTARQAAPHPHQVRIDPQNKYFIIPDLGADILRVFWIDPKTLLVSPRPSIPVAPGSGPRHGQFLVNQLPYNKPNGTAASSTQSVKPAVSSSNVISIVPVSAQTDTPVKPQTSNSSPSVFRRRIQSRAQKKSVINYYLVSEIASTLTGYQVSYLPKDGGLHFTQVTQVSTYGLNKSSTFVYNAPAEIAVAPNGKSLLVSNRNATDFKIPNPDPKNATLVDSDTLATFSILENGKVKFNELSPAGGSFPRQFAENPDGSLVAVGLQNSGRVAIFERCKETGLMGHTVLADFEALGAVTSIVWAN